MAESGYRGFIFFFFPDIFLMNFKILWPLLQLSDLWFFKPDLDPKTWRNRFKTFWIVSKTKFFVGLCKTAMACLVIGLRWEHAKIYANALWTSSDFSDKSETFCQSSHCNESTMSLSMLWFYREMLLWMRQQ